MKIYLVRHGAYAMDYSGSAGPALSAFGREQAHAVGALLRAQGILPEVIVTSPYLRTQETAQCIQEELGSALDPIISQDFTPNGDPSTMRAILEALPAETILVVGHMCSIGDLAQHFSRQAPAVFGTCSTVALEREAETWHVQWVHHCERNG